MPAPVLGAIGNFIQDVVGIQNWPEEIPRYDTDGVAINPQAAVSPQTWPVVQVLLVGNSQRDNTFEDSYGELPPVVIRVWGTSREQVDPTMQAIESALLVDANWAYQNSLIGQQFASMNYPNHWLYDMEIQGWTSQQRENERLAGSLLCWMAEMQLTVGLHGQIAHV